MLHVIVLAFLGLWIFVNVALSKMKAPTIGFVIVNIIMFVLGNLVGAGLKAVGI